MARATEPIMGKHDVIHETGSTYHILLLSEEDRATRPRITCAENVVKFGVWFLGYATDKRHADTLIAMLHTHTGAR